MSKIFKTIKKYWIIVSFGLLVIVIGNQIREKIGNIEFPLSAIVVLGWGLCGVGIICIIEEIKNFNKESFAEKAEKLWRDTRNNARPNLIHYMNINTDAVQYALPIAVWGQLISIYSNDAEIVGKLLEMVDRIYREKDDLIQITLSYILLNNCSNNAITVFFENNQELKQQYEKKSREFAHSQVEEFYNNVRELDEKLVFGLLHACLPNNSILENNIVYILRSVLGTMVQDIDDKNTIIHTDVILKFILIMPLIEEKIRKANIVDDDIKRNIDRIKNSSYLRDIVKKSYQQIRAYLNKDNVNYQQFEYFALHASILCVYYDKISWKDLNRLHREVKSRNDRLHKYFEEKDERVILLILSAAPLQMFESNGDMMYQLALLACLCANELI